MKRLVGVLFALFATCLYAYCDGGSKEIEINEIKHEIEDRAESNNSLHILYYTEQSQLEVSLSNIGEVTIYVLDSHNRIVTSTVVDTDTPVTEYIDIPHNRGQYCIIIESKSYYGYGIFKIQ